MSTGWHVKYLPMKASMATRNIAEVKVEQGTTTDYVLHTSQSSTFNGIQHKVIDFGEHKLAKYITTVKDPQQKMMLMALLQDYIAGNVAIAWKRGRPLHIKVTKSG